jgi:hypothetical protein
VSADPDGTIAQAKAVLVDAGIAYGTMDCVEPTLEDVFVSVLAGDAREESDESR